MVSVNKLNILFSELRGAPVTTVETYSRTLRKEGVLPETRRGGGASEISPEHAALMLLSIMRGSPTAAASNARELGSLVIHDGGGLMEAIHSAHLAALGWEDGITLAQAIAWLIDQAAADTMSQFARDDHLTVEVDRYWTTAKISWNPTKAMTDILLPAHVEAWGDRETAIRMLDIGLDDIGRRTLSLEFHSPLLYAARVSYGVDKEANRTAHQLFRASKAVMEDLDVWGTEKVTQRTIGAIAQLFRDDRARRSHPDSANAARQSAITVPGTSVPGQHEDE